MKKHFMLTTAIIMILLTLGAYCYERSFKAPKIKQPSISIASKRFGLIKKIVWTNKFMNDNKALIILSSRNTNQGTLSCLYRLDTVTGKYDLLCEFPAHKNLSSTILFDAPTGVNCIVCAYDKGIIKVNYPTDDIGSLSKDTIEIDGFETANSMDFKGRLIYARENDNLLYVKNLPSANGSMIFGGSTANSDTAYYEKPFYIVNFNSLNSIISYTSVNKSRIDLYAMREGTPVKALNLPVIKDVVSASGIDDGFGFAGMNISDKNKLNLFLIRNTIDKYNNDDYYSLDTVPYNTDQFGAVPAVASITDNKNFSLAYTSYNESHKGILKICGLNEQPRAIVSNENIFGPVSMTQVYDQDSYSTSILYFTFDNGITRVKICNDKGENVKDITDMVN